MIKKIRLNKSKLISMHKKGCRHEEIAGELSVSRATVSRRLQELGFNGRYKKTYKKRIKPMTMNYQIVKPQKENPCESCANYRPKKQSLLNWLIS